MKGEPLGLLHGVPFSAKDVLDTRGVPTTHGSRLFADGVPDRDAVAVGRLRAGGAVILGKTATSEFGHKAVTESPLFGITRNPWNLDSHPEARREAPPPRWRVGSAPSPSGRTAVDRYGFPPPSAGSSGSSPRTAGFPCIPRHPPGARVPRRPHRAHRARRGGDARRHGGQRRSRSPFAPGDDGSVSRGMRRRVKGLHVAWTPISGTPRWRPRCGPCARTPRRSSNHSGAMSRSSVRGGRARRSGSAP